MAPLQIIGRILLLTLLLTRAQSEPATTSLSVNVNLAPPPAPIAPTSAILKPLEGSCRYNPGGGICPENAPCCLNGYCSGTNYGTCRDALSVCFFASADCAFVLISLSTPSPRSLVSTWIDDPRYCSTGCEPRNSWKESSCFPQAFCSNIHEVLPKQTNNQANKQNDCMDHVMSVKWPYDLPDAIVFLFDPFVVLVVIYALGLQPTTTRKQQDLQWQPVSI